MFGLMRLRCLKHKWRDFYWYKFETLYIRIIRHFTIGHPLKNVIVIESHDDFDCNGGAFYSYLLEHHYNDRYKIVWLLKNHVPRSLPKNVKGYLINKPSFMKAYYRCVAKIFTADNVVTPKVRKDQKEYYLTHGGITFKNVKGLLNVPEHVDYVLSSSFNYDPYICENYSIPYPNEKMLHFGYPRDDCFYEDFPDEFLKISTQSFKKVIMWMPTFRRLAGTDRNDSTLIQPLGVPLIEDFEMYQRLNAFLKVHNMFMILKIHPGQNLSNLKVIDQSNIKVLTGDIMKKLCLNLSLLMKSADALISDYSSSAYHYLLLDRPIAFVLSDLKEYKLGFSIKNYTDFLPGKCIYTFSDFIAFLEQIDCNEDPYHQQRLELREFLFEYKDGGACERLARFMNL